MAKKSNKEKSQKSCPSPTQHIPYSITTGLKHVHTNPCTIKSWINTAKQCKQPKWPQLIEFSKSARITSPPSLSSRRNTVTISSIFRISPFPPPQPMNINIHFKFTFLSVSYSPKSAPRLLVSSASNPAFLLYHRKLSENRCIMHKSTTIDPYDLKKRFITFTNSIIGFDGKLYAITMQGALVVMEETNDDQFIITGMGKSRVVPSASENYFKEYLLQSNGEILLIFLIYGRKSISSADEVEVYKLDIDRLEMVKVNKLDGRVLFLENETCGSANSKEIGFKDDCVYFRGGLGDEWWMYNMQNGCISTA